LAAAVWAATASARCSNPGSKAGWLSGLGGRGILCLLDFPVGETIAYEVYDAAGTIVTSGSAQAILADEPPPAAYVEVAGKGYAPGLWTVSIRAPSFTGTQNLEVTDQDTNPWVELNVNVDPNAQAANRGLDELLPGDVLTINGAYLPPLAPVSLGIYTEGEWTDSGSPLSLRTAMTLLSDEMGTAQTVLPITEEFEPGRYCLVLVKEPGYDPSMEPLVSLKGATQCITVR
jgi:hypothetical protein